jgi:hypothetical protein
MRIRTSGTIFIYNEYPEIVSALSDSLETDFTLPNNHAGFPGEALSFDPNGLVSNLALPNLGSPVPKPTRLPSTVPTTVRTPHPTAPTINPTRHDPQRRLRSFKTAYSFKTFRLPHKYSSIVDIPTQLATISGTVEIGMLMSRATCS